MLKDHRPYFIKKAYLNFQKSYARRFLKPQFDALGEGCTFMRPWHVELFGGPISLGSYATVIATADNRIRLSVWPGGNGNGRIRIGDYCLLCPGVRISSAERIDVGNSCMFANRAYITDSDWHGLYDRTAIGRSAAVKIEDNAWIGDSAIICKGVTIGANSIIGAGAVVVSDVPANTIAAGNPARVVKQLEAEVGIVTRAHWFAEPGVLFRELDRYDRHMLHGNSVRGWLRYLLGPRRGD